VQVGDAGRGHSDNLLIEVDNLAVLKALLPFYRGAPCAPWPRPLRA
jgi:hypothetical protein